MNDDYLDAVLIGGREEREVVLAEYDEAWLRIYEEHRARILNAIGGIVRRIEHVGSTSVPGLAAKPIVDIMVTVDDPDDDAAFLIELESAGYVLRVKEPNHRMFRTPERDVHVHIGTSGRLCTVVRPRVLVVDPPLSWRWRCFFTQPPGWPFAWRYSASGPHIRGEFRGVSGCIGPKRPGMTARGSAITTTKMTPMSGMTRARPCRHHRPTSFVAWLPSPGWIAVRNRIAKSWTVIERSEISRVSIATNSGGEGILLRRHNGRRIFIRSNEVRSGAARAMADAFSAESATGVLTLLEKVPSDADTTPRQSWRFSRKQS